MQNNSKIYLAENDGSLQIGDDLSAVVKEIDKPKPEEKEKEDFVINLSSEKDSHGSYSYNFIAVCYFYRINNDNQSKAINNECSIMYSQCTIKYRSTCLPVHLAAAS